MTLAVGGCSFSSNFNLPKNVCWPVFVANNLDTTLINESRIQGSNWRIWRTITDKVLQGKITNTDTIIIQYTEVHRQEIWSPVAPYTPDSSIEEPYDGGKLFRFKYGSHMYGRGLEKPLSQLLLKCSNEKYEMERFTVHHNMFCGFLKSQGFKKVWFLDTVYSPFASNPIHNSDYPIINGRHLLEQHLPDDPWHLSELGHRQAAELLLDFIKS